MSQGKYEQMVYIAKKLDLLPTTHPLYPLAVRAARIATNIQLYLNAIQRPSRATGGPMPTIVGEDQQVITDPEYLADKDEAALSLWYDKVTQEGHL